MAPASKTSTILVVEDDRPLNDAYKLILEKSGYDVRTALNGKEALEAVREIDPDIILLDLRMPVLDGIGFLTEYDPKSHPNTSIVVFSNYDSHADIDKAYELGVDRYVLKARTAPKDLLALVDGIIEERD
jgi:DNA-binding response OmpR family regulator